MIAAPKDSKNETPLGAPVVLPGAAGDRQGTHKTLFEGACGVKIGVLRSGKVIS